MRREIELDIDEQFIKVVTDVNYTNVPDYFGEMEKGLKLDLLLPLDPTGELEPRPLIIWIIGGGWVAVSKSKFLAEMVPYAKAGYAVASIEYRVAGQSSFPSQIIDVKSAIRYLRAHADRYNLIPNQFYVMGESAGGHLAALAATSGKVREWDQGSYLDYSSCVQGCVDLYGICDFRDNPVAPVPELFHDFKAEELLAGGRLEDHPELYDRLNPLTYADEDTPPFLILHGQEDQIVNCRQSVKLYEGLQEKGIRSELILVAGAGHADPRFYQSETRSIIMDFLDGLR